MKITLFLNSNTLRIALNSFYDTLIDFTITKDYILLHDQLSCIELKTFNYKINDKGRREQYAITELNQIKQFPIKTYKVHRKVLMKQLKILTGDVGFEVDEEQDYVKIFQQQPYRSILILSFTNNSNKGYKVDDSVEWDLKTIMKMLFD